MARSINQVQKDILQEGLLDQLASGRENYLSNGEGPITERLIAEAAGEFILRAVEILNKLGKTDTGELSTALMAGDIVRYPAGGFEISIGYPADSKAAEYYAFVDKGVKGIKSSAKAPNSPYQYRTLGVSPKMVNALEGWVKRQGLSARTEDQKRDLSRLQIKRLGVRDAAQNTPERTLAFIIARNIKRTGIPATNYFSGTINEYFGRQFVEAVSKAISQDIRLYIRQSQQP